MTDQQPPGLPVEQAGDLPGDPDCFGRLWTPYRMAYINGESKPTGPSAGECPFCRCPRASDPEGLIVHRGRTAFVVMNLYPYSPGHLLVCPYRHVASCLDLTEQESLEVTELTRQAIRALNAASHPAGFNLGMNQGEVAGAGIAAHLHQHVVPRWAGDTNFLPIIARTRALPQLLEDGRALLASCWPQGGQ